MPIECPGAPPLQDSWSHDPKVPVSNPAPATSSTRDRTRSGRCRCRGSRRLRPAPFLLDAEHLVVIGVDHGGLVAATRVLAAIPIGAGVERCAFDACVFG